MNEEGAAREPGLGNMLFGYVLLGLQPLPVVLLAREGIGSAEVVGARFGLSLLFIGIICLIRGRGVTTKNPKMLTLRGLLGGCAVLLYFYSIQNAGASRGTLLNYTYPLWANLISVFFGQRPALGFWGGLAVALLGVWLVVVPEEGWGSRPLGTGELAGLGSAIFAGAAVLTIKQLRRTDESLTIIASFSLCGLLMSLFFFDDAPLHRFAEPPVASLGALVGALAFVGHVFFTRGYRGMSVQHATVLSLIVPLIATLVGIFFLGERYTPRVGIGAGLILAATGFVLLKKGGDSPVRRPAI